MIHFQIIDSPDLMAIGDYNFSLHYLTFGKSLGQTLPISDPELKKEHLILKTTTEHLMAVGLYDFLINNKKVKGTINLKIGDIVTIGRTSIKIINFNFEHSIDPNKYHETLNRIGNDDPILLNVIEKLEVLYIELTGE